MIHDLRVLFALVGLLSMAGCTRPADAQPAVHTRVLSNGVQAVLIRFPDSTNTSLFSFLPMGLCSDAPGKPQWSHLVEHMVIRSTVPDLLMANAETTPDHMRLDFYGNPGNWKEGLDHHRRWLEGVPFSDSILAAEKPKVIAECDFTARNLATHKFAMAAWAQGFRHGNTNVALKGAVESAPLSEVQAYRDARLFDPKRTTICCVGSLEPDMFFEAAEVAIGRLASQAEVESAGRIAPGKLDSVWDLDARHVVVAWPIPDASTPDHAALLAAAQLLNMQFFGDASLKATTGHVFAGADLAVPEGPFFVVSASLKPVADPAAVLSALRAKIESLRASESNLRPVPMIGKQLAFSLRSVPDPAKIPAQAGMTRGMLEGNLGLMMGMHVHRYGTLRESLAQRLEAVTASQVGAAISNWLTDKTASTLTLRPRRP